VLMKKCQRYRRRLYVGFLALAFFTRMEESPELHSELSGKSNKPNLENIVTSPPKDPRIKPLREKYLPFEIVIRDIVYDRPVDSNDLTREIILNYDDASVDNYLREGFSQIRVEIPELGVGRTVILVPKKHIKETLLIYGPQGSAPEKIYAIVTGIFPDGRERLLYTRED